jgi:hypothetical protein
MNYTTRKEERSPEMMVRVEILQSLLASPRGKLEELKPIHDKAMASDPIFYPYLALWYFETGEVRDHKHLFVAHLLTSNIGQHREVGWKLLQRLAVYEVAKVVKYSKEHLKMETRQLRSAVQHYLVKLNSSDRIESAIVRSSADLKYLTATLHLKAEYPIQKILFEGEKYHKQEALLALSKEDHGRRAAKLITDFKLPYTSVVGALKVWNIDTMEALVGVMSPAEVVNHLKMLAKRDGFDSIRVKAQIDRKIAMAAESKNFSTLRIDQAVANTEGLDSETLIKLKASRDKRISLMSIKLDTALFVDISSSMNEAIEVAKKVAAMISGAIETGRTFKVYTFAADAHEIKAKGPTMSDWEEAFKNVRANGMTSIGAPFNLMVANKVKVDQVILITDEAENTQPYFHINWKAYSGYLKVQPKVISIQVNGSDKNFQDRVRSVGAELITWEFKGDYLSLPNLLPLLSGVTNDEVVEEIMSLDLPYREDLQKKREQDFLRNSAKKHGETYQNPLSGLKVISNTKTPTEISLGYEEILKRLVEGQRKQSPDGFISIREMEALRAEARKREKAATPSPTPSGLFAKKEKTKKLSPKEEINAIMAHLTPREARKLLSLVGTAKK